MYMCLSPRDCLSAQMDFVFKTVLDYGCGRCVNAGMFYLIMKGNYFSCNSLTLMDHGVMVEMSTRNAVLKHAFGSGTVREKRESQIF